MKAKQGVIGHSLVIWYYTFSSLL